MWEVMEAPTKRTVATVEICLYERMVPLLGGYLEAYAAKDPLLKSTYRFIKFTATPRVDGRRLISDLVGLDADVYAFGCYVWNMGLINTILPALMRARPSARVILGGPQVMHHAGRYLRPELESISVCDGEGEVTFSDYLRELTESHPDLLKVRGLSFYRDGELVSTGVRERLASLDDIPSPFLTGLFDASYTVSILETNRGCPFHCGFCYWGAATNDRVYRFSEERIKEELTWISKARILFLYIADANWGMLKRDLELSRHLAECKLRYEAPTSVYFSAAKNTPDNVTAIATTFAAAGIASAQPVSLQTMNSSTLQIVGRQNIKESAYVQVQNRLKDIGIGSYTELIWPLPGETPASFRDGVARLCRVSNGTIIVYPHLLLHNTPLYLKRNDLGIITTAVNDGIGEAELVTETNTVSPEEFCDGIRHFYAVYMLRNARTLRSVADYLDRMHIQSYTDFFDEFSHFFQKQSHLHMARIVEESVSTLSCYDVFHYGKLAHYVLHEYRQEFNNLIDRFVASLPHWADQCVRFLLECDRITRPYVYSSTPFGPGPQPFEFIHITSGSERRYEISVPREFAVHFARATGLPMREGVDGCYRYRVDHNREQYPYMAQQGLEHNAVYCYSKVLNIHEIVPQCTSCSEAMDKEMDTAVR